MTLKKIVSWSYFAIILACLFIFYNIYQFLNKNIYQVVIRPGGISALETATANETIKINVSKFNDIVKEINKKTAPREAGTLNNPFD